MLKLQFCTDIRFQNSATPPLYIHKFPQFDIVVRSPLGVKNTPLLRRSSSLLSQVSALSKGIHDIYAMHSVSHERSRSKQALSNQTPTREICLRTYRELVYPFYCGLGGVELGDMRLREIVVPYLHLRGWQIRGG